MQFIAKLHHNFRNVNRLDRMVLLTAIIDDEDTEFRDHAWIPLTKSVEALVPKSNRRCVLITFTADVQNYAYDHCKQRLTNIKNIKLLGRA